MNQPPTRRLRVPRHRGTTAHVCSAYPFLAEPGLGARGVYIGTNVLTGGAVVGEHGSYDCGSGQRSSTSDE